MAIILTKEQIRALYGFKANEEVVAFGRAIKQSVPRSRIRKLKLEDFEWGSAEYNALYDRIYNRSSKPAVQVIESQVVEQIF